VWVCTSENLRIGHRALLVQLPRKPRLADTCSPHDTHETRHTNFFRVSRAKSETLFEECSSICDDKVSFISPRAQEPPVLTSRPGRKNEQAAITR
jgi:hypothetical protein